MNKISTRKNANNSKKENTNEEQAETPVSNRSVENNGNFYKFDKKNFTEIENVKEAEKVWNNDKYNNEKYEKVGSLNEDFYDINNFNKTYHKQES